MSAKAYTIEDLLVGQYYRSHSRHDEGTILHAEKREGIYYGENLEAYAVQVSSKRNIANFWATVAVRVAD
jgi:hypothetical protein